MQPIYTYTLTTATNNFNFNNIPQTFTDLQLVISARATGSTANQGMYIQFNGVGGTTYSGTVARGFGSSVDSFRFNASNAFGQYEIPNELNTTSTFSSLSIYIPNYTSSNFKQLIADNVKENNSASTAVQLQLQANLFSNTSPITSMGFGTNIAAPNFFSGSTFSLYGITKG